MPHVQSEPTEAPHTSFTITKPTPKTQSHTCTKPRSTVPSSMSRSSYPVASSPQLRPQPVEVRASTPETPLQHSAAAEDPGASASEVVRHQAPLMPLAAAGGVVPGPTPTDHEPRLSPPRVLPRRQPPRGVARATETALEQIPRPAPGLLPGAEEAVVAVTGETTAGEEVPVGTAATATTIDALVVDLVGERYNFARDGGTYRQKMDDKSLAYGVALFCFVLRIVTAF